MANLDTLLKYQEIDIKLRRAQDSVEKSDAAQRGKKAKAEFEAAKKSVDDSERTAGEIVETLTAAAQTAKEGKSLVAEYRDKLKGETTSKERKQMIAELEQLKSRLSESEKKADAKRKQAQKVLDESKDSQARAKKMRDIFVGEKEKYEDMKQQKEPEIGKYKQMLSQLRPSIDPKLMKVYDELTAERKYPAFVDAYSSDKTTFSCRGCGLQLSQAGNSGLLKDGICRCDNCRRVIYMPKPAKK